MLITLTQEFSAQITAAQSLLDAPVASGAGFLDLINNKNSQAQTVIRAVTITLAICFVILNAIASRGAMGRIIISSISAALFCWIVWNITDLQDRMDTELNSAPPGPAAVWVVESRHHAI
jgi:hypothetical protein